MGALVVIRFVLASLDVPVLPLERRSIEREVCFEFPHVRVAARAHRQWGVRRFPQIVLTPSTSSLGQNRGSPFFIVCSAICYPTPRSGFMTCRRLISNSADGSAGASTYPFNLMRFEVGNIYSNIFDLRGLHSTRLVGLACVLISQYVWRPD